MLRAAALSLLMLFTIVTMLPLTNSSAHNERAVTSGHRKGFRRHSRAWWRRYRARQRRKRAALAQRKALEALRKQNPNDLAALNNEATTMGGTYNHPRGLWSVQMPEGWSNRPAIDGNEMKFRIYANGKTDGQATLSVVATANGSEIISAPKRKQSQSLSGVPVTALRRTVIDRMVKEGGWVVNDFQKEINGRRVFVVQAQMPASSDGRTPPQSQTYYFTEVDGRIYSLATTTQVDSADRVAAGSEQVMSSFSTASTRSAQTASSQR